MSYTALINYYGKSTERIMLTRGPSSCRNFAKGLLKSKKYTLRPQ